MDKKFLAVFFCTFLVSGFAAAAHTDNPHTRDAPGDQAPSQPGEMKPNQTGQPTGVVPGIKGSPVKGISKIPGQAFDAMSQTAQNVLNTISEVGSGQGLGQALSNLRGTNSTGNQTE